MSDSRRVFFVVVVLLFFSFFGFFIFGGVTMLSILHLPKRRRARRRAGDAVCREYANDNTEADERSVRLAFPQRAQQYGREAACYRYAIPPWPLSRILLIAYTRVLPGNRSYESERRRERGTDEKTVAYVLYSARTYTAREIERDTDRHIVHRLGRRSLRDTRSNESHLSSATAVAGFFILFLLVAFFFFIPESATAADRWSSAGQRREHADILLHSKGMRGTIFFPLLVCGVYVERPFA